MSLLNIRRWRRSHPLMPPYLTFFCVHCCSQHVQRSHTASPQCQQKSPGSSTDPREIKQNWFHHNEKGCQTIASHSDSVVFLVQTSSCNFNLESLWIPGTSILRYSIYRLNSESISMWRYCMYSWTVPCYLVHWVVYALLFAGWLCRQSV